MTTYEPAKRPDGVTVIAILQFITGGLGLLGVFALILIGFAGLFFRDRGPALGIFFIFTFGGLILGGLSLLAIFAGVGLLRLRNWARWVTIIMAILELPAFPIGTVIGALIIWYLLQDNVVALFSPNKALPPVQPVTPAPVAPTQPGEPPVPPVGQ